MCAGGRFPLRSFGLLHLPSFINPNFDSNTAPGAYHTKSLPLGECTRPIEKDGQRSIVFQRLLSSTPTRLFHSVSSIGGWWNTKTACVWTLYSSDTSTYGTVGRARSSTFACPDKIQRLPRQRLHRSKWVVSTVRHTLVKTSFCRPR